MKNLLFIIVTVLLPNIHFAQCAGNAGTDKIICVSHLGTDTAQIGGNYPNWGTPPYTFSWLAFEQVQVGNSTFTFTASSFLSDTTLLNPVVNDAFDFDSVEFVLRITDFNLVSCFDTVRVHFSRFVSGMSFLTHFILPGDSVLLSGPLNIWGGTGSYNLLWYPNSGLTDSTNSAVWAKPTETTFYSLRITDEVGCLAHDVDFQRVFISGLGMEESESEPSVYPNPVRERFYVNHAFEVEELEIWDMEGRLVKNVHNLNLGISVEDLPTGMYVVILKTPEGTKALKIQIQQD